MSNTEEFDTMVAVLLALSQQRFLLVGLVVALGFGQQPAHCFTFPGSNLPWELLPTTTTTTTTTTLTTASTTIRRRTTIVLKAAVANKRGGSNSGYTSLPMGISPFEKSISKSLDIQGTFRSLAQTAMEQAIQDGHAVLEMEFPPLSGGDQSKSQFDDFDNISELDANRDWCVQFTPLLQTSKRRQRLLGDVWLIFPDDKECELAKKEWNGQRYRSACRFTSIRAALSAVLSSSSISSSSSSQSKAKGQTFGEQPQPQMSLPWGTKLASTMNKIFQGGDGILADSSTLDDLNLSTTTATAPRLHLVCQPGNGGPVEDWINVQTLHQVSNNNNNNNNDVPSRTGGGGTGATAAVAVTCIVNGALDKVRDGYYPRIFFPALAATQPFYQTSQVVLWCKPIVDKGLYGWLFRVYPEPWQVILQTVVTTGSSGGGVSGDASYGNTNTNKNYNKARSTVKNTVALISEQRPSYQQIVDALVQTAKGL